MQSEVYCFSESPHWEYEIFQAARDFVAVYGVWPTHLHANALTWDSISLWVSKRLIAEGKIDEVIDVQSITSNRHKLEIALDRSLSDFCIRLSAD